MAVHEVNDSARHVALVGERMNGRGGDDASWLGKRNGPCMWLGTLTVG